MALRSWQPTKARWFRSPICATISLFIQPTPASSRGATSHAARTFLSAATESCLTTQSVSWEVIIQVESPFNFDAWQLYPKRRGFITLQSLSAIHQRQATSCEINGARPCHRLHQWQHRLHSPAFLAGKSFFFFLYIAV